MICEIDTNKNFFICILPINNFIKIDKNKYKLIHGLSLIYLDNHIYGNIDYHNNKTYMNYNSYKYKYIYLTFKIKYQLNYNFEIYYDNIKKVSNIKYIIIKILIFF